MWLRASDEVLHSKKNMLSAPLVSNSNSEAIWKRDSNIKTLDAHNLQRPETVKSLFLIWRVTKDPIYQE